MIFSMPVNRTKKEEKKAIALKMCYSNSIYSTVLIWSRKKQIYKCDKSELIKLVHCTVFRKAYILSGSGFHKFLYSIIENLRKIREIAEFICNQLRFHEKKTLAKFRYIIKKCKKTLFWACLSKSCSTFHVNLISMNMQQKKLANEVTW